MFHVELILPQGQNLGQMLRAEGYAELDEPVPQLSIPSDDVAGNDAVSDASAAAENAPFVVLPPVSPLAASSESNARLSAKRLVCNFL